MLPFALTLASLSNASAQTYTFEHTVELAVQFCWQATVVDPSCPVTDVTLSPDGTMLVHLLTYDEFDLIVEQDIPGVYWLKETSKGKEKLVMDFPEVRYRGTLRNNGCYKGRMNVKGVESSVVTEGRFEACPL